LGITILKLLHSLIVLLQDFDILYYTIYIMANIVGLTIHPFFFAFHLMDFLKLEQLKTVIQAIWNPKVELGLSFLLLVITS
jgi:inositol 1,4,5-triphosphate receptor type 3